MDILIAIRFIQNHPGHSLGLIGVQVTTSQEPDYPIPVNILAVTVIVARRIPDSGFPE